MSEYIQEKLDNRSNQLNPNNEAYWLSMDFDEKPNGWEELIEDEKDQKSS